MSGHPPIALPLYAQIAARLRAEIVDGGYAEGARIPSEHALSARFSVGRPTIRQATELLVRERRLERRRGSGTFVNPPPAQEVDLFSIGGTVAALEKSGLPVAARLGGRPRRRPLPAFARHPLGGDSALCVTRRSTLSGVPVLLEEMYFDPQVFVGLDRLPLERRSLSQIARAHYHLHPQSVEQRFQIVALDRDRARRLALEVGAPVLKVERRIDFFGAPRAFFAEIFCRTDRVIFTQTVALDAARSESAGAAAVPRRRSV